MSALNTKLPRTVKYFLICCVVILYPHLFYIVMSFCLRVILCKIRRKNFCTFAKIGCFKIFMLFVYTLIFYCQHLIVMVAVAWSNAFTLNTGHTSFTQKMQICRYHVKTWFPPINSLVRAICDLFFNVFSFSFSVVTQLLYIQLLYIQLLITFYCNINSMPSIGKYPAQVPDRRHTIGLRVVR